MASIAPSADESSTFGDMEAGDNGCASELDHVHRCSSSNFGGNSHVALTECREESDEFFDQPGGGFQKSMIMNGPLAAKVSVDKSAKVLHSGAMDFTTGLRLHGGTPKVEEAKTLEKSRK